MAVKLYVIPASHPSIAAELMLQRKGVDYKRRDLIHAAHKPILRALGFSGSTVPAMKVGGQKVQGSRAIARWLDQSHPEPALYPSDPAQRAKVDEAELWGDEELQSVPRRIIWYALGRDRSSVKSFLEGYRLGIPTAVAAATAAPIVWAEQKLNKASADAVEADLRRLPSLLDHVDGLIAEGVIGRAEPNAADYQIGTSVRLLTLFDQLRPLIEGRPAGEFALRLLPDYPGHVPAALPPDWVPSP